jgi:hypothetical protein
MFVDNGAADGPFPHYEASPEAIEFSAENLDTRAAGLQAFSKELDGAHRSALTGVSGEIVDPMSTATQTPLLTGSQIMGYTYISAGSVRLFGQGVQRFNTKIDELNERFRQAQASDFGVGPATYPDDASFAEVASAEVDRADKVMDARVAMLGDLRQQYRMALEELDVEGADAANTINAGPSEQTLQELYGLGVLPSSVEAAYPNVHFVATALPSDAADMSDEELAEYLRAHPELQNNARAMAEVAKRIEDLTMEDGEASGRTLRDALSDRASMADVEGELALLSLVGMYGSYAQSHGKALPKGASQYVRGLFTDLVHGGAEDRTMDVLDWITAREHQIEVKMPPEGGAPGGPLETQTRMVPGFDQATQDWMKRAYADGILLMSDGATNGLGREFLSPDVAAALNDVPKVQSETITNQTGTYKGVHLSGGDGFAKLADLLGHSSEGIRPATEFAGELTESAGETAAAINRGFSETANQDENWNVSYTGFEEALERFGPELEQVVDVAARNVDANEQLLANAGANPDSAEAEQLRALYTFQWSDDGESVSQYTDWIANYGALDPSEHPSEVRQATVASAGFIDFVTDTGNAKEGVPNTFKLLMQGATPDEMYSQNDPLSFGEVNPHLAETFGLVASSNLDAIGAAEVHENEHDTAYEDDGTLSVSVEDRGALFTLVATNDGAAQDLSRTIGAYEQARLNHALRLGEPALMEEVGAEANRLDGYMAGGLLNASEIADHGSYQNAEQAYQEHMRFASTGKIAITTGAGQIPVVGGIVGPTAGLFFDGLVTEKIDPPEEPAGYPVGTADSDGFLDISMTYDYVAAEVRAGHDTHLPREFFENGKLMPLSELGSEQRELLDDHLVNDPQFGHYLKKFQGAAPFKSVALNDVEMYLENKGHRR